MKCPICGRRDLRRVDGPYAVSAHGAKYTREYLRCPDDHTYVTLETRRE